MSANNPRFFSRYNPPPSPLLKCADASLTRQEFMEEADLNSIMKRYAAGVPLPAGDRLPMFDDFSNVPDYQTSLEVVMAANDRFMQLPSDVRRRFNDDPAELLAFIADKGNFDEAVKLGLVSVPSQSVEKVAEPPATHATPLDNNIAD